MQDKVDALMQAERTMMDAIHAAIIQAAKESEAAFQPLGPPTTAQAYFADAAMRQLFLHVCGANADTAKGGDPDHAWEILYLGRGTARYWEKERGIRSRRRKAESHAELEIERREKSALALSAQKFATDTVIRALVEHASISDPDLRDRIAASVKPRVSVTDPLSQVGQEFRDLAKVSLARLIGTAT
ncbi:hypothetical protein [Agrobacterium pusense]|uniref:hypothetical protein n=2 Tax=Agrobacterium pusense TaxID=648995 RepID=UPI0024156946|nr:hypothetical protein [Agrobacterium pusense]WFN87281.1 hypothetical protein P9K39_13195 [Agrobacterium pusense]